MPSQRVRAVGEELDLSVVDERVTDRAGERRRPLGMLGVVGAPTSIGLPVSVMAASNQHRRQECGGITRSVERPDRSRPISAQLMRLVASRAEERLSDTPTAEIYPSCFSHRLTHHGLAIPKERVTVGHRLPHPSCASVRRAPRLFPNGKGALWREAIQALDRTQDLLRERPFTRCRPNGPINKDRVAGRGIHNPKIHGRASRRVVVVSASFVRCYHGLAIPKDRSWQRIETDCEPLTCAW